MPHSKKVTFVLSVASAHVGHVGMCIAQLWTTFPGVLMNADLKKMIHS